jgi:predicted nucleotidyltransferase
MSDDAKEWVNIRIPETVRDDAREDPRTYGEIMRAGLNADADADMTVSVAPEVDEDALADVEDRIDDALADAGAAMTYDDTVAACRKAIREELPDRVLQG